MPQILPKAYSLQDPRDAPEGLNSRVQAIRVKARSYRNREHFKTAICLRLGDLQIYPATP